jgi:hypothetical protein
MNDTMLYCARVALLSIAGALLVVLAALIRGGR